MPKIGFPVVAAAIAASSWLACAARAPHKASDSSIPLVSRVDAYWKRREAKDLRGAYVFYCTAYKQRVPESEFLKLTRLTRFDLRDTRVVTTDPGTTGRLRVTVSFRFLMPAISPEPIASQTVEWWARDIDGQWCKEEETLVLPFPRGQAGRRAARSIRAHSADTTWDVVGPG